MLNFDIFTDSSCDFCPQLLSKDTVKTLIRIEESNLGFQYDRDELKFKLHEYITAPSLYKQKGDVFPPLYDYIKFLDYYLKYPSEIMLKNIYSQVHLGD